MTRLIRKLATVEDFLGEVIGMIVKDFLVPSGQDTDHALLRDLFVSVQLLNLNN